MITWAAWSRMKQWLKQTPFMAYSETSYGFTLASLHTVKEKSLHFCSQILLNSTRNLSRQVCVSCQRCCEWSQVCRRDLDGAEWLSIKFVRETINPLKMGGGAPKKNKHTYTPTSHGHVTESVTNHYFCSFVWTESWVYLKQSQKMTKFNEKFHLRRTRKNITPFSSFLL